jgi:UDPglucose--hexose-1-phosphate uridylyltransferase
VPTAPAVGACEVVVFTQDPSTSLGALPLSHLELVIEVWADRYEVLGARPDVAYVFPFENRGVEVGVTLHHPHGQLYAYPFVPPVAVRALEQQRLHYEQRGRGLLEELIASEVAAGERLVYRGPHAVAFMPVFARYSYEVWVAPLRAAPSCGALTHDERRDFARALKTVLMKYDALWQRPFPYILAVHQAPTDGTPHPEAHVRIELYPAFRMKGRLKFLAGSEIGAGVFTADTVPEEKVKELQAVAVDADG